MSQDQPGDGYTLGELARLVAATNAQVQQLAARLDALLDRLDDRFQRKDLAEAMSANAQSQINAVVQDVDSLMRRIDDQDKEQRAMRRLVLGSLLFPFLVAVVSGLILAVVL